MVRVFPVSALVPLVSLACLSLVGCGGDDGFEIVPVSGTVKLDGQALGGANVTLQPIAEPDSGGIPGPASSATADAEGRFELKTIEGQTGAVVGKHRLIVVSAEELAIGEGDDDETTVVESPIPDEYRNGEIEITIEAGGTDNLEINIPAKG